IFRGSALNEQDGGAVLFLYSLGRGGIPPAPSFRLALASDGVFFGGFGERILQSKIRHQR
ncbi:hypothetical protein COZ82_01880, partial [Candidatus Kaiserbacteria bacterium CG_4_8_14_3_um_filter_38_9]